MDKYIIGFNKEIIGYEAINITDNSLMEMKDNLVIILLDDKSNNMLYEYYLKVRELILNRNKIILILDGSKSRIRKQIGMLLVSFRNYNIYTIDDIDSIDRAYLDALDEREPSEEEVRTFIGADLTAYSNMNELMLEMAQSVSTQNIEKLRVLIEENSDSIEGFIEVVDYMKQVVDTVNSGETDRKINEMREKIDKLEEEKKEQTEALRQSEGKLSIAQEETLLARRESTQVKKRVSELETRLNNQEAVIRVYSEVKTQMVHCKAKSIIYFKEVSPISYITSMVDSLFTAIKKMHKLRVKLIIYDNKNGFLSAYKPIPVVGASEFFSNKSICIKYEKMVVVEPNQAILEETLNSDWDVVIIYDRLKQAKDLVTGNNVHKYWVINSRKEYTTLDQTMRFDATRIITRPGVIPESLTVREMDDYKSKTEIAKLAAYMGMMNTGIKKAPVLDIILDDANIKEIANSR